MNAKMTQSDISTTSKQKRDGRIVLVWVFGFFATFIAVDAYMVMVAVTTQTGMVIDRPYERGLAYNDEIDAARRQQQLGWRSELLVDGHQVVFTLRDAAGQLVNRAVGTVTFFRPSYDGADFSLDLMEDGAGMYRADFSNHNISGRWQIRVNVQRGEILFRDQLDVTL